MTAQTAVIYSWVTDKKCCHRYGLFLSWILYVLDFFCHVNYLKFYQLTLSKFSFRPKDFDKFHLEKKNFSFKNVHKIIAIKQIHDRTKVNNVTECQSTVLSTDFSGIRQLTQKSMTARIHDRKTWQKQNPWQKKTVWESFLKETENLSHFSSRKTLFNNFCASGIKSAKWLSLISFLKSSAHISDKKLANLILIFLIQLNSEKLFQIISQESERRFDIFSK